MKFTPNLLRKLAGTNEWQTIFNRGKESSGLHLFVNCSDFGRLQTSFLQWLHIYSSLESDLYMDEANLTKEIIEDEIRCDAYLLWKSKKKNKDEDDKPTSKNRKGKERVIDNSRIPSMIFK